MDPVEPAAESPPEEARDPVFHYSRERRLRNASSMVRAMNEGGEPQRQGLLKKLFVTRGNALFFACIILISFVFLMTNHYISRNRGLTLGGNFLTLVIVREEGTGILNINKTAPRRGEVYLGAVDISVSPELSSPEIRPETPTVFQHRIVFGPAASEFFRVSLPFEGDDFFISFRAGDETRSLRVRVNP